MKRHLAITLLLLTLATLAEAQVQELWITNGSRRIYGELFTPPGAAADGPVAIVAHGFTPDERQQEMEQLEQFLLTPGE